MYNLDWQRFENAAQPVPELETQTEESVSLTTDLSEGSEDGDDSAADAIIDVTSISEIDWLNMTQKLRQLNRDLLKRVSQLQEALNESQEALQVQKGRSLSQAETINKQNQELGTASEQMTRLFRELESSHQVAQRQQILIETLTQQLESSQERVAQLERECALTQQRYNEQSHQLIQTENTARELRDRLVRQQRHTLQFKAALEKCLDMPPVQYEPSDIEPKNSVNTWSYSYIKSVLAAQSLVLKAPPIQPWSAPSEIKTDKNSLDYSNTNSDVPEEYDVEYCHQSEPAFDQDLENHESLSSQDAAWFTDYTLDPSIDLESLEATSELLDPNSCGLTANTIFEFSSQESNGSSSQAEIAQQSIEPTPPTETANYIFTFSHEPSAWHTEPMASVGENNPEYSHQDDDSTTPNGYHQETLEASVIEANVIDETVPLTEDPNSKPISRVDLPLTNTIGRDTVDAAEQQAISSPSNWPSPMINAQRHTKKRKSYASVELPKLPPI